MQIAISGQHVEITEALHAHVSDKVKKIERRHADRLSGISVVLQVEKNRHTVEATGNTKGAALHVSATSDNMYTAIDMLMEKLDRRLIKHKEKHRDHRKDDRGAVLNEPNESNEPD